MSVRFHRARGTWPTARHHLADVAQAVGLGLVVLPLLLAFVAVASLLGLH
jgi:hypothetical protein